MAEGKKGDSKKDKELSSDERGRAAGIDMEALKAEARQEMDAQKRELDKKKKVSMGSGPGAAKAPMAEAGEAADGVESEADKMMKPTKKSAKPKSVKAKKAEKKKPKKSSDDEGEEVDELEPEIAELLDEDKADDVEVGN